LLEEVLPQGPGNADADNLTFPESWHEQEGADLHFLNVQGPPWASLDYYLNPWGELGDGLWEMVTDKYAPIMLGTANILTCFSDCSSHRCFVV
jgi:hypothetical protein